jgi:predicted DNA-binding WGR domain protein
MSNVIDLAELGSVEILQVGAIPARGIAFDKSDLQEIADNTNKLIAEGLHNPPGKLGHDDAQAFALDSGLPATGWVDKLTVVGDKLMASFKDVPKILMRAFKEKLYRKISSEVYFNFSHPKTHKPMGKVLRAVAFLGQDIPQVKGLADFLGEKPKAYAFAEGDHARMGDVTINITLPGESAAPVVPAVSPTIPNAPAPGLLVAEGLAGRELEFYRQAEKVADVLKASRPPEFADASGVDPLLRYVGRVGPQACSAMAEFRQESDAPEELCSWLNEQALKRGYVAPAPTAQPQEEVHMDDKTKILEAKLAEIEGKCTASEQEANELKAQVKTLGEQLAAKRKEQVELEVKAFVEQHKAVITPAIEPTFRALCETVGQDEIEVKLGEKPEKMTCIALVMKFAEALAKAKAVPLGETAGGDKGDEPKVESPKGANFNLDLHEAATKYLAEQKVEKPSAKQYFEAVKAVIKANPEMAQDA